LGEVQLNLSVSRRIVNDHTVWASAEIIAHKFAECLAVGGLFASSDAMACAQPWGARRERLAYRPLEPAHFAPDFVGYAVVAALAMKGNTWPADQQTVVAHFLKQPIPVLNREALLIVRYQVDERVFVRGEKVLECVEANCAPVERGNDVLCELPSRVASESNEGVKQRARTKDASQVDRIQPDARYLRGKQLRAIRRESRYGGDKTAE
jgi:hypothetical protein